MPKTEAAAYLCHCIPGRMRFRIPDRRGDEGYFSVLAKKLAALPGIETVQVSPLTGSVLLTHALDAVDDIGAFAKAQHLFEVTPQPDLGFPMAERIANNVHAVNREFKKLSDGAFDYWSLAFLVLLGMAIYQILKGNIAAPATTLLWYALGTLLIAQRGEKIPVPIANLESSAGCQDWSRTGIRSSRGRFPLCRRRAQPALHITHRFLNVTDAVAGRPYICGR